MGTTILIAVMVGLFGMAFLESDDDTTSNNDGPVSLEDDPTPDGDDDLIVSDPLPIPTITEAENAEGGRDIEINLTHADAQQLLDLGLELEIRTDEDSSGWIDEDNTKVDWLHDLGALGPEDNVNINVPDDFPFEISPTLQFHYIDGPGLDFVQVGLAVLPNVAPIPDPAVQFQDIPGGPIAEGDGFDYIGLNLLGDDADEQAQIDAWMAEASVLSGQTVTDLGFDQFENGTSINPEDFGERTLATPSSDIDFFVGSIPDSGGTVNGVTFTPLTTTLDVEGAAFLVEEGANAGVVFLATPSTPADLSAQVFSVNGVPLDEIIFRPLYS